MLIAGASVINTLGIIIAFKFIQSFEFSKCNYMSNAGYSLRIMSCIMNVRDATVQLSAYMI